MSRSTIRPRDGVVLHFEEQGDGEAVFFQHGLGADAAQAAEVFPAEPPVRRITLECRAQGRSDAGPLGELSIRTFSEDLAFLAERLGIRRAVVGGISMGAAVSLRLAVLRPDLVSGLVLARPAWLFDHSPDNMRPFALVGELLRQPDRKAARDAFARSDTAKRLAGEAPDNLASLLGFFDRPESTATADLLTAIAADGPGVSEAEAKRIAVPTLVIGHRDDLVHPLAYAQRLGIIIPNARMVEIASKVASRERYVTEFRSALADFLGDRLR
jgi:pimeloyl-ACP methyl ester carboxylesterase